MDDISLANALKAKGNQCAADVLLKEKDFNIKEKNFISSFVNISKDKKKSNDYITIVEHYLINKDSHFFEAQYREFHELVYKSLELIRNSLVPLLFPLFVFTIEKIMDNFKQDRLRSFISSFKFDFDVKYREELNELFSISSMNDMRNSQIIKNYFTKEKLIFHLPASMSEYLINLLFSKKLNTMYILINEHFNIVPHELMGPQGRYNQQTPCFCPIIIQSDKIRIETPNEQDFHIPELPNFKEGYEYVEAKFSLKPERINIVWAPQTRNTDTYSRRFTREKMTQEIGSSREYKLLDLAYMKGLKNILPSCAMYTFYNTDNAITCTELSVDGSQVMLGTFSGLIHVWRLKKGLFSESDTPKQGTLIGHKATICSMSVHSTLSYLLSSDINGNVRLWSLEKFISIAIYRGHSFPVYVLKFSPLGPYFFTGSQDTTARIWSSDKLESVRLLVGHEGAITCGKWSSSSLYIATGSSDRSIILWDLENGKCLNIYRGHKAGVCQLDINPYDLFIMSGDETGEIIQWDLRKGGILKRFNSIENIITQISFSYDGYTFAVGSTSGNIYIWYLEGEKASTEPVKKYMSQYTIINKVQYTQRNLLIAVGILNLSI